MVALSEIRDIVSSLFIMLNKDKYVLFRIEFLVVFVTLLFLAMFIMDIFRRSIHSSLMKAIFSLFDAVSDSIVTYLLGAMTTAPFKNQLFPVWGLVLVIFRHNIDFISGYGVPDRGGRRFTEWRNVIKLLGSALLNQASRTRFKRPLWTLWALQLLRSWYRFHSHHLASNSTWHGGSSELVSEHMHAGHDPSIWKPENCDPKTMAGYKYLVYGERVKIQKPRYALNLEDNSKKRSSLVTLEKIWKCKWNIVNSEPDPARSQGNEQKDLSMAFALSRLLRCRLEDVILPKDVYVKNRELVKKQIIEEPDAKRGFRVLELQMAYVNDYFNTRYPMVFWLGLRSLNLSLLQSVVTIGVVLWLSVDIRRVYKPPDGELAHLVQGVNVDMIITWVFMFFMMFKEIWEMVAYLLSDWTRVLLVCMYANCCNGSRYIARCMEKIVLSFFKSKITAKRWHGLLDQFFFMQSYDDSPKVWNWLHMVTTGVVPRKEEGAKLGKAIAVPDCVRSCILDKLHDILKQAISENATASVNGNYDEHTDGVHLPKDIMVLTSERNEKYRWAYLELQTSSQVILVWHIATSFCEMALAKKCGSDLSKPGFLSSIFEWFTSWCSSKRYLIHADEKEEGEVKGNHSSNSCFTRSLLSRFRTFFSPTSTEKKLLGELGKRYIVANSLSRYCTYLLVSKPELIPDSFLVPQMIFRKSVKSARDILKSYDSLESRYDKLRSEAEIPAEESQRVIMGEDVVKQGAMLGKQLLDEGEEGCWEILADVWTELIIHIAATWNAEAHKKCLESGGEFITIIWSLLWHCGIEKSKLWPEDDITDENDAATDPQMSDAGNNNMNITTGTDSRNHQTSVSEIEEINDQDHAAEDRGGPWSGELATESEVKVEGTVTEDE